jgi:hypothetical protein
VQGRFNIGNWLLIKFDKLKYYCWVAPSVIDVTGDTSKIYYATLNLQSIGSNQYGPPHNIQATRNGNKVTITWDVMNMTVDKDRGYFLDVFVCQDGNYLWYPTAKENRYKNEAGCNEKSGGDLYTVEKHGYSEPAKIPWPAP